jgi:hypothetical protein
MDVRTTAFPLPGRPRSWVIVLLVTIIAVPILLATGALGEDPPALGDWDVTTDTTLVGTNIVLTGNLTVHDGATLSLSALYLRMNLTTHGQYNILVEEGAGLEMDHLRLDSTDRSSRFNLTIEGSAHMYNGSYIQRMDGPTVPNPLSTPQGLVILSSDVLIEDSYVQDCGGFAITIQPNGFETITPTVRGCRFGRCGGGIYVGGFLVASAEPVIRDCEFAGNSIADIAVVATGPTITNCTFGGGLTSTTTVGIAILGLADPVVSDCTFSFGLLAITSVFADPVVRDCTISEFGSGIVVVGNEPSFERVDITNVATPVNLTATTANLRDVTIDGLLTGYAVIIDGGVPHLTRLSVDPSLVGSGVRIFNNSQAVIRDSTLSGRGASSVVWIEDSDPLIENCTIEGGGNGIELRWSPATIDGCTIVNSNGWGILSFFETFTGLSNDFGTGDDENGEGHIIQYYNVRVRAEHEGGQPAVGASVTLTNALDVQVDHATTDDSGLALDDAYIDYMEMNDGSIVIHSPYLAEASLDDLANSTTFNITGNPTVVVVLGPLVDLPPVVTVVSPVDGGEYDVWELGNRVHLQGSVVDPEGGEVSWAWFVDGDLVNDNELALDLDIPPGPHQVALMGSDEGGGESWVYVNMTVVSVPPTGNFVEITSPVDGAEFDMGDTVTLACEYYVLDHPELEEPVPLPVTWTSDVDGLLLETQEGDLTDLTPGTHVITVTVLPRYPEFIPDPYTDSVVIAVLPPEPVAVAVISSPEDGSEFRWDATVHLAANGSYIDVWDPPEYRTIYRWSSDIDGLLGDGKELDARHLATGAHNITLLLTTDPYLVSDGATIIIIVHPEPNNPPVARISVLSGDLKAGRPVNMTAALSADPDGDAITYAWDLGDGNVSSEVRVDHTYADAGNYTVGLTVSDGTLEGVETLTIQVLPADDGDGNGDGNGGDGGDGGDDDGTVETSDTWIGWVFILLLFAALGALLYIWYRGRPRD